MKLSSAEKPPLVKPVLSMACTLQKKVRVLPLSERYSDHERALPPGRPGPAGIKADTTSPAMGAVPTRRL